MDQKTIGLAFAILLLGVSLYSCSVKGIQSPIVLRSPLVLQKTEGQEPPESPVSSGPSTSLEEAKPSPGLEQRSVRTPSGTLIFDDEKTRVHSASASREPVGTSAEAERAEESALPQQKSVQAPADILLLSDEELADTQLSILARIYISIPANEFTQDRAVQELKVEAFERFGPLAYGIANIEHRKKASVLPGKQEHEEVSADVITLTQKETVPSGMGSGWVQSDSSVAEVRPELKQGWEAPSLESIRILTPDDLYHLNFRIVGRVEVHDRSKNGYTEDEAVNALKTEAIRNHGIRAMGLSNVKLVKKNKGYYYKKARRSFSLTKGRGTYIGASADVVSWD
jgi:hypothetical protein